VIVDERLFCSCGIEVKIARLVPGGLGHVTNPKERHHAIRLLRPRLARDDADSSRTRRHREGPDSGSGAPGPAQLALRDRASKTGPSISTPGGMTEGNDAAGALVTRGSTGAASVQVQPPLPERMWTYIDQSAGPDGCWPWTGARQRQGYGRTSIGPRHLRAHRVVLGAALGRELSPREYVLHHCDNPPCCNPAHLFLGTSSDNMRDAVAKGRHIGPASRTHCKRGHDLSVHGVRWGGHAGRQCRVCNALRQRKDWKESRIQPPVEPTMLTSDGPLLRTPSSARPGAGPRSGRTRGPADS
jgi:hypothetical protein